MLPKILIAEDDMGCLTTLRDIFALKKEQLKVICTSNGIEAVTELKRHTISLLITDIRMPKMNGLELLAFVNEHYPKLPCIAITAYAKNISHFEEIVNRLNPDVMEMIQTDSLRFFSKPFQIDKLRQTVLEMLAEPIQEGTVQGFSIASFIQLVEVEEKTCVIEVYRPNKEIGLLLFKDGVLSDAVCGAIRGEEAAIRIIAAEKTLIRFKKPGCRRIERRIHVNSITLIVEAVRRKDELNDVTRNALIGLSGMNSGNRECFDDLTLFESEANQLDKLISTIKKSC